MPKRKYEVPASQPLITTFFKTEQQLATAQVLSTLEPGAQPLITSFFKLNTKHNRVKREASSGLRKQKPAKRKKYPPEFIKIRGNLTSYDGTKTWQNYFLSATNNFTMFSVRLINSARNEKAQCVFKPGTEVATAEVDYDSNLTLITVHEAFQKRGIGTELVRFMNERCPQFHVQETADNLVTSYGAKLFESCIKKRILSEEQVIIGRCAPPSPQRTRR